MKLRHLATAAVALTLAGCVGSNLKIDYFALTSPPAHTVAAQSGILSVHVGPTSIPDGVDKPQLVVRGEGTAVTIDDNRRWAEPLKDAIPRVIADSLSAELGTPRVMTSRQSASLDFDYRVAIDVQHFDSSATGASDDVIWTIRTRGNQAPRVGRTVVQEPASGIAGVAEAHSRALARVSHDIAEAIRAMPKS
jgi:uncharacterized lipoprotein YmbA